METTIKSVRVKDIILDEGHPLYLSVDSIGIIFYKDIQIDDTNLPTPHIASLPNARPLFSFIKNHPLKDEIVLIIESQSNVSPIHQETYYFPIVNIQNHAHHNAYPFVLPGIGNTNVEHYTEAENGQVRKSPKDPDANKLDLGNYFQEKTNIRSLRSYEGDTILEGRFGNSLRFGATIDKTQIARTNNNWSNEGEIGDPITIIRNGQGIPLNIENPKLGEQGWVQTIEKINEDDSSIYLTSNQQITGFIPASINWKSWGANLIKPKSIFNPVLDEQTEPIIEEQIIAEVEEPVIVEPVVPPPEEIEEEINEKTFEDSSNITEYYTDTNRITPSTTSYINKGTLHYKWTSEENNPQTEEFPEITDGLNHFIGANFTLKQLISSNVATKPEFDIHEGAELERMGIYFNSTGESPTGVVEGYDVLDILGFYAENTGPFNKIIVKDSEMNIIYETPKSSGHLQDLIEGAESEIFSAGSAYYDYNMPNPGINNYPGIDSDIISGDEIVSNLKKVMENCIDKIITNFDNLEIISAYRSVEVSNSVDDSPSLDHVKGYAIDFNVPGANTSEIFNWCFENLEEWKDLMWAYPERGRDSWIHISYEEGKNEKHTTLATDIDSMHEWYESDRRGDSQQYQDGILEANQEIVILNPSDPPPPPPPPPDVKNILDNESFTVLSGVLNGNDITGQEVRVNHFVGGSSGTHHEIKFTLRDPSSPTSPITLGAPPIKIEGDKFPRLTYVIINSIVTGATDLAHSRNDGAVLLNFAVSFDEPTINDKLSSEATTPKP